MQQRLIVSGDQPGLRTDSNLYLVRYKKSLVKSADRLCIGDIAIAGDAARLLPIGFFDEYFARCKKGRPSLAQIILSPARNCLKINRLEHGAWNRRRRSGPRRFYRLWQLRGGTGGDAKCNVRRASE